jgi:DNA repair exonuclease SbcCD nuclease subunit
VVTLTQDLTLLKKVLKTPKEMITKIVHFSDLHIRLFKDHDLYRRILTDALNQWKEIKPDRIVFTGDLVHSKNQMTPELVGFVAWILTECSKVAKTILIPGNHDALISNMDRLDSISPVFKSLNNPNIVYYKDKGVYEDENISWCVYSQFQGNVPPEIETAKGYKIGLFHGPINGLKSDLGFDFGEEAYDTSKFDGLDIVLCGDIHKRAVFNIPNGKRGVMIGSCVQQNFGENMTKHGYGVYDINTDNYEFFDLKNPKPFLKFKITSFEDLVVGGETLINF